MFGANKNHQYHLENFTHNYKNAGFSDIIDLSEREQKALDNSWAE